MQARELSRVSVNAENTSRLCGKITFGINVGGQKASVLCYDSLVNACGTLYSKISQNYNVLVD